MHGTCFSDLQMLAYGNGLGSVGPVAQDDDGSVWKCALLFGKGDFEQLVHWGHRSYNAKSKICSSCDSDRARTPWTDLRLTAAWRATTSCTHAQYLNRIDKQHPISKSPFFNKFFFRYDLMHCFDHHGISAVVAGSVLMKLVRDEHRLGDNQQARLDNINVQMKLFQNVQRPSSRMPTIRLADLIVNEWWELGGTLIKAANTRQLIPFISHLAHLYFDTEGNEYHDAMKKFSKSLRDFYNVLWAAGMFLTEEELRRARADLLDLGFQHMRCRKFADDAGELAFQIKPKAHYGQHFFEQMGLINPRHTMCYQDESLIGVITNIYKKSCAGPYESSVQRTVVMKYLVSWAIGQKM